MGILGLQAGEDVKPNRNEIMAVSRIPISELAGAELEFAKGWDTVKGKDTIIGLDRATGVPN